MHIPLTPNQPDYPVPANILPLSSCYVDCGNGERWPLEIRRKLPISSYRDWPPLHRPG